MSKNYIFSSESVGEGHPDKVCDTISDAVLDACLAQDPTSRVACETYAKSNLVVVGGEITTKAKLDFNAIARQAIRDIGYTHEDDVFHADRVLILNAITSQSPDIAQGVDARKADGKETAEQGAGDQGLMFGYATNETPELMPAPIMYAHQLGRALTKIRKNGKVQWLRPDAKSQVSVRYVNDQPVAITNVVISTQHSADAAHDTIKEFCIEEVIKKTLPKELLTKETKFLINPTGRFVVGGPQGDTGLTGRKIIVDSYGGMGRHGGGAFSGKDPSKVDRSAAYMGRYVAKNIVAAERSPAKTRRKSIAAPPTWAVTSQKTSSLPAWLPAPKSSLPTRSAFPIRFRFASTHSGPVWSAMKRLSAPSVRSSVSSLRPSSSSLTCSGPSIPRRPITDTLERMIPISRGRSRTKLRR